MNEYDSAKMLDVLNDKDGMELTDNAEEADVLLLNTCSIREKAQEKVFSQIGRWRPLKEKNPNLIIGVGGCVASQEGEALRERAPLVDVVFGPQTLHRLPEMIGQVRENHIPIVDITLNIDWFTADFDDRKKVLTILKSLFNHCNSYKKLLL